MYYSQVPEDPRPNFDNCQKSDMDGYSVMVSNGIRICPYLIGIKTVSITQLNVCFCKHLLRINTVSFDYGLCRRTVINTFVITIKLLTY